MAETSVRKEGRGGGIFKRPAPRGTSHLELLTKLFDGDIFSLNTYIQKKTNKSRQLSGQRAAEQYVNQPTNARKIPVKRRSANVNECRDAAGEAWMLSKRRQKSDNRLRKT